MALTALLCLAVQAAKLEPKSREIRDQLDNLKEQEAQAVYVEKKIVKKQIKGIDKEGSTCRHPFEPIRCNR